MRAADVGVDGLMISNHGARQLDRAIVSTDVLPAIDAAVGDRMTLMLDGGIRRGADIIIALCMGAKFISHGTTDPVWLHCRRVRPRSEGGGHRAAGD